MKTWKKDGLIGVVGAELQATLEGLKLAQGRGLQSIILEGDSRVAIEPIENSIQDLSYKASSAMHHANYGVLCTI